MKKQFLGGILALFGVLVIPAMASAQLVVATSTLTGFLSGIFNQGFGVATAVLNIIWPYLLTIAVLYLFWRVGKSIFRVR